MSERESLHQLMNITVTSSGRGRVLSATGRVNRSEFTWWIILTSPGSRKRCSRCTAPPDAPPDAPPARCTTRRCTARPLHRSTSQ
ncbi:uncharacterized protein V6R79_014124 [Siganus canaliculatus]